MKFLTIRQPYASLIAVGAKTIETRPFSTQYRGPLAIHAGKARPTFHNLGPFTDVSGEPIAEGHDLAWLDTRNWPTDGVYDRDAALVPLPLGAVVAVCDLVDVVPIVEMPPYVRWSDETKPEADRPYRDLPPTYVAGHDGSEGDPSLWLIENGGRYISQRPEPITDQFPFGDFTPGRYAWLLENVRPIDPPVPMKGAQGLRDVPADVLAQIEEAP